MKVGVYSLKSALFDGEAISVNCKTANGEITVLNHHRPLVTLLEKGTITIIDNQNKEHFIPVSSGFLEITAENKVKLIIEE
ncbi:MAG: F0F1 ATP synthase subunit epsilon [Patescibacteria group bacterium]